MKSHTRVAVIGGGVVGCSVLFHLARHGWTDVVLIEQGKLTSGSTWHAAGLVLAPGLVLALLYQRGRDWRWCALAHCGMNALALGGCAL